MLTVVLSFLLLLVVSYDGVPTPAQAGLGAAVSSGWAESDSPLESIAAGLRSASKPDPADSFLRFIRGLGKTVVAASSRWSDDWLVRLGVFLVLAMLMPVFDWTVLSKLGSGGVRAAGSSAVMAVVVYARLLIDPRAPLLGKVLVAFGVVYGMALSDLLPDSVAVTGQLDDFLVLLIGSRAFASMCPTALVEHHARIAARRLGPRRRS